MTNPFQTAPGSIPRIYKGRDSVFAEMERAIETSYRDHWNNILLVGSTGMGKSSLLAWAANRVGGLGWPILSLSVTGDLGQPRGLAIALARGAERLKSERSVMERARAAVK